MNLLQKKKLKWLTSIILGVISLMILISFYLRYTERLDRILYDSSPFKPTPVIPMQLAYDEITAYLDHQVEMASINRKDYWQRDFSSVEAYSKSVSAYREDFRQLVSVPQECLEGTPPTLKSNDYITSLKGVDIFLWKLNVCNNSFVTHALVGIPTDAQAPLPLIIIFHGTSGTPEKTLGLENNEYHHQFGLKLAQEGYMVFVPLIITQPQSIITIDNNRMRNELDNRATSLGRRLVGIEIGQAISTLDYLETLDNIDASRIGTYGISLGGLLSFYLGAVDTRIEVVVVSQYIEDRIEKLVDSNYQSALWRFSNADYSFTPELLLFFTDVDIASLIMPRKLFIEVGLQDQRYAGTMRVAPKIQDLYNRLGLPSDSFGVGIGEGGHEIYLTDSLEFLNRWLEP